MINFIANVTNLTVFLPQPHDCSCYVSRRTLTPLPPWLQNNTDLRVHNFAHSHGLWNQTRLANVTCVWCWTLCGINPSL